MLKRPNIKNVYVFVLTIKMQQVFDTLLIIFFFVMATTMANENEIDDMDEEENRRRVKEESELIVEAGCKEKEMINEDDSNSTEYKWVPSGILLAKGACINERYQKHLVPEPGKTKVY